MMSRIVIHKPHFEDHMVENFLARLERHGIGVAYELRDAVEKYIIDGTLSGVLEESATWSEETFPLSTPQSIANHLAREAEELKKNPTDEMEMADVQLLLNHLVAITGTNIVKASRKKLDINRARQWGEIDSEGVVEHIREKDLYSHATQEVEEPKAITVIINGRIVFEGAVNEVKEVTKSYPVWVPPVYPIFELGEDGRPTGRYAIYLEANTGEISWSEADAYFFVSPDSPQARYVRYLRTDDKAYN
jgi:hypothetical protein